MDYCNKNTEERYIRCIPALSEEELLKLRSKKATVIGCGGLGGYVIEYLARLGIGSITCVDGDVFAESNLNRQLLCTPKNIGMSKAEAAADRVRLINPAVTVNPVNEYFSSENAGTILTGADIAIDALDSINSRLELEDAAAEKNIFLIHGAIDGWSLQFMAVPPGTKLLHKLYIVQKEDSRKHRVTPCLPMTAAACAAFQVSAAADILCGLENFPKGKLFSMSMKDADSDAIPLDM